jgi:tetratricopeptide (TPR) repeat protein
LTKVQARAVNPAKDLKDLLGELKSKTGQAPGVKAMPQFVAGQRKTPGGRKIGFVTLKVGDEKKTVAEIFTAAGGYDQFERARQVSRRMQTAHKADPLWWTQMRVGNIRQNPVVAVPQSPDGYIITADANFARAWNTDQESLAKRLINNIRLTYDRLPGRPIVPETAVDLRIKGDEAYDSGNVQEAEQCYLKAKTKDRSYAEVYQRLAELYAAQNQTEKMRQVVQEALSLPSIDEEQRKELQQLLQRRR